MWISFNDDARTSHVSSKLLALLELRPCASLLASCHLYAVLMESLMVVFTIQATMSIEFPPRPAQVSGQERKNRSTYPSRGMNLLPGSHSHLDNSRRCQPSDTPELNTGQLRSNEWRGQFKERSDSRGRKLSEGIDSRYQHDQAGFCVFQAFPRISAKLLELNL